MSKRYQQAMLVSCLIPWDDGGELIEDLFRYEIRETLKQFNNLYIFGTAGEGYAVSSTQFKEIVGVFGEETAIDGVHPMVCIIAMSTAQVVERIGIAHDLGFRVFQITLPSWEPLRDEEVMTYFKDVCGSFPDSKFLHYNLGRSSRILNGSDYRRLEYAEPNFVGTKTLWDASISGIFEVATMTSELQHFYQEASFPYACMLGECSMLSGYGSLFPTKIKKMFQYGITGQTEKAFELSVQLERVVAAMMAPARDNNRIDGVFDKMIVRASGIDIPLKMQSPYKSVPEDVYEACVAALQKQFPEWPG